MQHIYLALLPLSRHTRPSVIAWLPCWDSYLLCKPGVVAMRDSPAPLRRPGLLSPCLDGWRDLHCTQARTWAGAPGTHCPLPSIPQAATCPPAGTLAPLGMTNAFLPSWDTRKTLGSSCWQALHAILATTRLFTQQEGDAQPLLGRMPARCCLPAACRSASPHTNAAARCCPLARVAAPPLQRTCSHCPPFLVSLSAWLHGRRSRGNTTRSTRALATFPWTRDVDGR